MYVGVRMTLCMCVCERQRERERERQRERERAGGAKPFLLTIKGLHKRKWTPITVGETTV